MMITQLQAYAWLPEGTIGIGAKTPPGAFVIAAVPLDTLYEAIKTTACRDTAAPGCYSLPGPSGKARRNPRRTAVTAFIAYRRTVRACLSSSRNSGRQVTQAEPRPRHDN